MDVTVIAYATLGLSLFVSAIKAGEWILHADPRSIINAGRWGLVALGALALAVLIWLIVSGRWPYAMMLAAFMLPVFVQAAPRWRVLFGLHNPRRSGFPAGAGFNPGTVFDSCATWRGPPDADLVQQSIAVLRAYVEQTGHCVEHLPSDAHRSGRPGNGFTSAHPCMSTEEALKVLGLEPHSSPHDIREAYRRLVQIVDPHSGGTQYLRMKINEAREVLLGE